MTDESVEPPAGELQSRSSIDSTDTMTKCTKTIDDLPDDIIEQYGRTIAVDPD